MSFNLTISVKKLKQKSHIFLLSSSKSIKSTTQAHQHSFHFLSLKSILKHIAYLYNFQTKQTKKAEKHDSSSMSRLLVALTCC